MARLQIAVYRDGSEALPTRCLQVPVLWGSRVRERVDVDGAFAIEAEAHHCTTHVAFEGVDNASSFARTLSTDQLLAGYAEAFDVATSAGFYTVNSSSRCE